jgi:hypothetical protein
MAGVEPVDAAHSCPEGTSDSAARAEFGRARSEQELTMGWRSVHVLDERGEFVGAVWVAPSGWWWARCAPCEKVVGGDSSSAPAALLKLQSHVESSHAGDNPGAGP